MSTNESLTSDEIREFVMAAHGISLLTHAAISGGMELLQLLFRRGATAGASAGLSQAVSRGYLR